MPVDIAQLTDLEITALRAMYKSGLKTPAQVLEAKRTANLDVVTYGETKFYIPETGKLLELAPIHKIILPIISGEHHYTTIEPFYSTIYYTSIKKTAKTFISGLYAAWRAEQSVLNDEILFFANDEAQSRGRAYAAIQKSLELDPNYDRVKRIVYDAQGNPRWRIIEDFLEHVPTQTRVRAVNVDYRGEAGSNPSLSVWTEVWGFDTDKQFKLFDEMTPVLTRYRSQRYLEGYAGYVGKSKIQERVEQLCTDPEFGARQLTIDDIPDWPWPLETELPLYVNDQAGIFAYIDRGPVARTRVPWTQGPEADKYYAEQALTLTPEQYERLHFNNWVSDVTAFIPPEWWRACAEFELQELPAWRVPVHTAIVPDLTEVDPVTGQRLIDKYLAPDNWRVAGPTDSVVISVDASVSGDCTALIVCRRHPTRYQDVVLEQAYVWTPPKGGKLDYEQTPNHMTGLSLKQQLYKICMEYNVVELAYDDWQMHLLTTEISREAMVWCRKFSQSSPRDVADKQLYDLIKLKRIAFNPMNPLICTADIERHIKGAARQQKAKEDTKLHIVKASSDAKIDLVVALSMCTAETLRLDL